MNKAHRYIAPILGGLVFLAALFVLRHELKAYEVSDILTRIKALPKQHVLIALLLTGANYFIMTGYDYLALGLPGAEEIMGKMGASGAFAFTVVGGLIVVLGLILRDLIIERSGSSTPM